MPPATSVFTKISNAIHSKSDSQGDGLISLPLSLCETSNVIVRRFRKPTKEFTSHERVSQHPNIVTLYKIIEEGDNVCAVLESCEEDIGTAITEKIFHRNDELVRSVFLQILSAVQFCHERGVFHRDLRPENILCSSDKTSIRLANFGLSTLKKRCSELRGSRCYMSPECINGVGGNLTPGASYSTGYNDLWALGIILINLVTGCCPWNSASNDPSDPSFAKYIRNPRRFLHETFPAISHDAVSILTQVLHVIPVCRLSIPELMTEVMNLDSFFDVEELSATSEYDGEGDDEEFYLPIEEPQFAQVLEIPAQDCDVPITAARLEYMFEQDFGPCMSPIRVGYQLDAIERPLCSPPWFAGLGTTWAFGSLSSDCDEISSYPRASIPSVPVDVMSFFDADEEVWE